MVFWHDVCRMKTYFKICVINHMGDDFKKIVQILRDHAEYGLTLTELMTISGLSYSVVVSVFETLEDSGKLKIKSDGLSRIYNFKE